jgi:hypothetical protein
MTIAGSEVGASRTPDAAVLRRAASTILAAIRADETTCDQLIAVLVESGRLPADPREAQDPRYHALVVGTLSRFAHLLGGLLQPVLAQTLEDDGEHLAAIRRFFLEPQDTYSLEELAALWRIHPDDVRDIYYDQLVQCAEPGGRAVESMRIAWTDAVGTSVTFGILRPFDIERALGSDFTRARPEMWRTFPILIHLPRFIAEAIALDASIPPKVGLPVRIEQFIVELFTCALPSGGPHDEVPLL